MAWLSEQLHLLNHLISSFAFPWRMMRPMSIASLRAGSWVNPGQGSANILDLVLGGWPVGMLSCSATGILDQWSILPESARTGFGWCFRTLSILCFRTAAHVPWDDEQLVRGAGDTALATRKSIAWVMRCSIRHISEKTILDVVLSKIKYLIAPLPGHTEGRLLQYRELLH